MNICDACPAHARITMGKPGLPELHFCQHHFNEHADALYAQDWLILDHITPWATSSQTEPAASQRPAIRHKRSKRR